MVVRRRQQKSLKLLRGCAKDPGRWGPLLVGSGSASPSLERERKQAVELMSGERDLFGAASEYCLLLGWSVLGGYNTEEPREVVESGSVRLRKSVNVARIKGDASVKCK